ncbi:MAG: tyrosine-type recombinase/integrase [Armatimonadetes bacterium]|nr:tyrosine-type recombinase/integrase [Armatimonadota bacterium]
MDYRGYSPATTAAYERDCNRFIEFLETIGHPLTAEAVTTRDVQLFVTDLSSRVGPSSVRRALYALSSFFNYLCDTEIVSRNPAAPVEPPKRKRTLPRFPSETQCQRLLQACETPTERLTISLLLLAGLRRAEVLGLNVSDIDTKLSQMTIRGKGGRERVVPISSGLRESLSDYLSARDAESEALLVNEAKERMGATTLYRMFHRVLGRANLSASGLTPHSLRHGFATMLIRAGVDIATIAELLGHSNIATTSIYLHATAESKRAAVESLQFETVDTDHEQTVNTSSVAECQPS